MQQWPHAPVHRLDQAGAYMVSAGTLAKEHFFGTRERLDHLQTQLLSLADQYAWRLQAWAVFSNHYHFVALAPDDPSTLPRFLRHLHSVTARFVNALDRAEGRKVWFQYWETHLTFERSYLARLAYVHTNPVKHGICTQASAYPWCSAAWFEREAPRAFWETVYGFRTDQISIADRFDVLCPTT